MPFERVEEMHSNDTRMKAPMSKAPEQKADIEEKVCN